MRVRFVRRSVVDPGEDLEDDRPSVALVSTIDRRGLRRGEADAYLEHLIERWRLPLAGVEESRIELVERPCRWGPTYCVSAMLEHAVMHPLRHRFQLEEALAGAAAE